MNFHTCIGQSGIAEEVAVAIGVSVGGGGALLLIGGGVLVGGLLCYYNCKLS